MVDFRSILRDLQGRRARLREQLEKLDATIGMLEDTIRASEPEFDFEAPPAESLEGEQTKKRSRGELPPETVAKIARETLIEHGRPMKRGELVKALEAREVPLAGKDKNKNLGTILWRHASMFVSLDGLGYWPKDVALAGVYDPEEWDLPPATEDPTIL